MDDDSSKAAEVCKKWGVENGVKNVGKWSGSGQMKHDYTTILFLFGMPITG